MKKTIWKALIYIISLVALQLLVGKIPISSYFYKMVLSAGVVMFVCSPVVFKLMSLKGGSLYFGVYSILVCVIYTAMGFWYVGIYMLVAGILGALLMRSSQSEFKRQLLGWTVYSGLFTGMSILPVWCFWEDYSAKALANGMTAEHLQTYYDYYTSIPMLAAIVTVAAGFGCVGMILSRAVLGKKKP